MDNYVKGVKVIEIYDAANKELLVKYDDKHNIDKVISALNIKSWKETEKSIGMNPKYTIKFYCDTTNQDEEKDIKEITLYENGEYATIFITSPGGVKQNYKSSGTNYWKNSSDARKLIRKSLLKSRRRKTRQRMPTTRWLHRWKP